MMWDQPYHFGSKSKINNRHSSIVNPSLYGEEGWETIEQIRISAT